MYESQYTVEPKVDLNAEIFWRQRLQRTRWLLGAAPVARPIHPVVFIARTRTIHGFRKWPLLSCVSQ